MSRSPVPAHPLLAVAALAVVTPTQEPASGDVVVVAEAGTWSFAGGASVEVERTLFHGADIQTTATIRWPPAKNRPAMRYRIHVGADTFGRRQPWSVAWQRGEPILWIVEGRPAKQPGRTAERPPVRSLRRVDLADPRAVSTIHARGVGPEGFLPPSLASALAGSFGVPVADGRALPLPKIETAAVDHAIEVLCRVRVSTPAGEPVAGVTVRFPAIIPREKADNPMRIGTTTNGDATLPANGGLATVRAVSAADGVAFGLVPLSSRATDHGALVRPTAAGLRREKLEIAPLRLSPEQYRDHFIREPTGLGRIRGRLLDGAGRPVVDALVAVAPRAPAAGITFPRHTRTAANGAFALTRLPAKAPLRLLVRHGGVTVALADPATLSTDEPSNLRLVLSNPAGEAPTLRSESSR